MCRTLQEITGERKASGQWVLTYKEVSVYWQVFLLWVYSCTFLTILVRRCSTSRANLSYLRETISQTHSGQNNVFGPFQSTWIAKFYSASEIKILHIRAAAMVIINRKNIHKTGQVAMCDRLRVSPTRGFMVPLSSMLAFARSYESIGGHCWPILSFPLAFSVHGKFLASCQNEHRGQILPHKEIFRDALDYNSRWWPYYGTQAIFF